MNDLRQEIIETLIFEGAQTAAQLADSFSLPWCTVMTGLENLARSGQARAAVGSCPGDGICPHCDMTYIDFEPGQKCDICNWYLVDDCKWVFCGGPVSQALTVAATTEQRS